MLEVCPCRVQIGLQIGLQCLQMTSCRHLGETQRAMHYSPEWCRVDNAWKDMWICYGCSNTVGRDLLFEFMMKACPWALLDRKFCHDHGSIALVVDCSDRSTLALGGRSCTRRFSTYNMVIQCTETMCLFPLPHRKMSRELFEPLPVERVRWREISAALPLPDSPVVEDEGDTETILQSVHRIQNSATQPSPDSPTSEMISDDEDCFI